MLPLPTLGYPGPLSPAASTEVGALHRQLLEQGPRPQVLLSIVALIDRTSEAGPAVLLSAQASHLEQRDRDARDLVQPLLERYPTWWAARVTAAAAAESIGDVVGAWSELRTALEQGAPASFEQRASLLEQRAVEILGVRFREALAKGHLDAANDAVSRLERWAPGADQTLEAVALVAAAAADTERETVALTELAIRRPTDRLIRERLADLALVRGDASGAITLLQALLDANPGDRTLIDKLAAAKFRFRLGVLPSAVQALARQPMLRRAGYARLLYWLVPGLRVRAAETAPIATDVLDRAEQQEIVRVLGWGLLDVRPGVYEFAPERPLRRREALLATLRAMRFVGSPLCLEPLEGSSAPSAQLVCQVATDCRLIATFADCLPDAEISGPEAIAILALGLEPHP